jgi:hypothetical protein
MLGIGFLLLAGAALLWTWRRAPVLAFGVAWAGLALVPVSNILTATGVVLAERTLFLPSVGVLLAVGASQETLIARLPAWARPVRALLTASVVALVALGAARSMERQTVWRSEEEFFRSLVVDAPDTYRAHLVASVYYLDTGRPLDAERAARRGLDLYARDPQLYEHLGQVLRRSARCNDAIPILTEGVRHFPDRTVVRSRLIECALAVGDTILARSQAEEAIALGQLEFQQTRRRLAPH